VAELDQLAPQERGGRAAYLLREPALYRALRRRSQRWRGRFGAHDGGVIEGLQAAWTAAHPEGLASLVSSPTALQSFAQCPYRFWLYALLRLRDDTEPLGPERLDPRTRGSMFHEIQFRFFRRCQAEGRSPSFALDLLDDIWRETVERYREEIAPAIAAVYDRETVQIRIDLRGWWRRRAEAPDGFEPANAELAFGLGRVDPDHADPMSALDPVPVDGRFAMRGSIDLVERDAAGGLRVTDYKTGRPPSEPPEWTGHGETLQPLVYAVAAEQLLGGPVREGRLAYCTVKHGYRIDAVSAVDRSELVRLCGVIDDHVRRGFFPAAPREGACRTCDYVMICGHGEAARVERKDREKLSGLDAVRRVP